MTLPDLTAHGVELAYGCAAVVVLCLVGQSIRHLGQRAPAIRVAALAATGCTAYSADTSWRFAADFLDMSGAAERAAMFAAAELALLATALMARQNLNGPKAAPGTPGLLVWVITSVQVIPAYAESGPVGGTVRAFVGPVMAAMLWHLAMGIELRHHKPSAVSHGFGALIAREIRERLLSRLGLAQRDRDAAQITRDRATVRAVALAARLAEMHPERREKRYGRRVARSRPAPQAPRPAGGPPKRRRPRHHPAPLTLGLSARQRCGCLHPGRSHPRRDGPSDGEHPRLAPASVHRTRPGERAGHPPEHLPGHR
jgi:hypothetical protein